MACQITPAFVGIESTEFTAAPDGASNQMVQDSAILRAKNVVGTTLGLLPRTGNGTDEHSLSLYVISTTESQVLVHHSRKRALLKSWTVKPGSTTKLTCPAVALPGTDSFLVIQNGKKLLKWSYKSESITKGLKATVSGSSLVKLLVEKNLPNHFVLVAEDGLVSVYSDQLKSVAKWEPSVSTGSNVSVLTSSIVTRNRRTFVVVVLKIASKNGKTKNVMNILQVEAKQGNAGQRKTITLSSSAEHEFTAAEISDELTRFEVQPKIVPNSAYYIVTSWSSGSLVFYKLPNVSNRDWFKGSPEEVHRVNLGASLADTASVGLGDSYFCLASHHKTSSTESVSKKSKSKKANAEGAESSGEVQLTIWDAKFGIVMFNTTVPSMARVNQIVRSRFSSAFAISSSLSVNIFEFSCPKPTLAGALGKLKETERLLHIEPQNVPTLARASVNVTKYVSMLDTESPAEVAQAWGKDICSRDEVERRYIEKLTDTDATPTEAKFESCFFEFVSTLARADQDTGGRKRQRRNSVTAESDGSAQVAISSTFSSAVVNRCCREGFWRPLEWLLARGVVSCNACPELLAWLLHHRQLRLLYRCFQLLPDVSEKQLVDCLVYVSSHLGAEDLEALHEDLSEQFKLPKRESKRPRKSGGAKTPKVDPWVGLAQRHLWQELDSAQMSVLNLVLAICSAPQNDVFLRHQVKRLTSAQVELVLGCLTRALDAFDLCPGRQRSKYAPTLLELSATSATRGGRGRSSSFVESGDQVEDGVTLDIAAKRAGFLLPTRVQVASWICALLDAHFQQLMMDALTNDRAKKLLERLQVLVDNEVVLCEFMRKIQQPIEYLAGGQRVIDTRKVLQDYTIEEVDF